MNNLEEKRTILIIDDIASNIQSLAAVLKEEYKLKIATSAKDAFELLKREDGIDLILLDIEMPDMDGYETLKYLQENYATKDIPIIFVTGYISSEDEEKGLEAGAVDYITKPIHAGIVKARVKTQMTIKVQKEQLRYEALHDRLTGLYNRYQLDTEGERKFARAKRHKADLSIIMLDIDHFKKINDTYGHSIGDEVLIAVAGVLKENKRIEDFSVRFGGEEFVVILEDCNLEDAVSKAESIRTKIESLIPAGVMVTSSFGVTTLQEKHTTLEEFLKEADDALYFSKEHGRNRVSTYKDLQK